jgi:DNA replication and repair protein RecF
VILQKLVLENFRNFPKREFSFSPQTTLILGPNTSGKTNILEAIFFLTTGHSFRAELEREMITYGEEIARIGCKLIEASSSFLRPKPIASGPLSQRDNMVGNPESGIKGFLGKGSASLLEIVLTAGQVSGQPAPLKKYLLNGVAKRMVDFIGNLRSVLFWPEDLDLITDSPSLRRRYLDLALTQIDREYRRCLLSYEKGLRQRNRLLEGIRDHGAPKSQLAFWDQLLIKNGGIITNKRGEFIDFINSQNQLSAGLNFSLTYDKSVISETRLAQYTTSEIEAGATLVGPHRDDFIFEILPQEGNGIRRDLSLYGSRGEQRLAILWLKLAELEYIDSKTGQRPTLLLDDIFSELDHSHRAYVLKVIPNQQTIMSTTDLHLLEKRYLKNLKIVELENSPKY